MYFYIITSFWKKKSDSNICSIDNN